MSSRLDFSHLVGETHLDGIELARGYFDGISYASGVLTVHGWLVLPDREIDAVQILLDGEPTETVPVTVRQDVAEVLAWIPHADRSGFGFRLQRPLTAVSRCRLDVLALRDGRATGRLSTLFRADLDTAIPAPPAALMERVSATRLPSFFRVSGMKSFGEFLGPIARHRPLPSVSRLLDWGCGCGRVTAHFLLSPGDVEVHGCDLDREAIAWCAAHLEPGRFAPIDPWPPTPYAAATFDLVIAFSVFTHLARDVQRAWLTELRRIIAPGGLLLASTHGSFAASFSYPGSVPDVLREGIADDSLDPALDGIAPPGYYRGVFQTREYTIREWSKQFEILEYIERGMGNFQDLVVMRRPLTSP